MIWLNIYWVGVEQQTHLNRVWYPLSLNNTCSVVVECLLSRPHCQFYILFCQLWQQLLHFWKNKQLHHHQIEWSSAIMCWTWCIIHIFDELIEPVFPHTVRIHAVSTTTDPMDSMTNISFGVKRNIRRIYF